MVREALLVDCRGAKVVIGPGKNARLLNCKFDEVVVQTGRILAKGCEFGTLDLVKDKRAEPYYYLEDCTVKNTKESVAQKPATMKVNGIMQSWQWPDPAEEIRNAFERIETHAFQLVDYTPDLD